MPRAPLSAYFCLAVAILIALGAVAPAEAANTPHLFGSGEVRSSDLRYFPTWTDMLEHYMNDVPHKVGAGNYPSADYWATPRQSFDRRATRHRQVPVAPGARLGQQSASHRYPRLSVVI